MPQRSLPPRPDLDQLRSQAKELLRDARAQRPDALAQLAENHPRYRSGVTTEDVGRLQLADVQLTVARSYGFASWRELKAHVDAVNMTFEARVERFVKAATHEASGGNDSGIRAARKLLEMDQTIRDANVWTALVFGDVERVRDAIGRDPSFAATQGGPWKNRQPLHYVCYSRFNDAPATARRLIETARLLLDNGADPNAAFEIETFPDNPLRPLYGACGVANFPEMADLLLDRGADINDFESLYHSLEHKDSRILDLLVRRGADPAKTNALNHAFEFRGTEHIAKLLKLGADPNEVYQPHGSCIFWAVAYRRGRDVLQMLIEHAADARAPREDGRTPYEVALRHANFGAAEYLESIGAAVEASPFEQFCAACAKGNRAAVEQLLLDQPDLLQDLSATQQRAIHYFAEAGQARGIEEMLHAGFPVNVLGHDGETPLHIASWHGWPDVVRVLLANGADLECVEKQFGCTPLGWAAHGCDNWPNSDGDYPAVVRLLREAGADLTSTNRWNENLIDLAGANNAVVELLREGGAPEPVDPDAVADADEEGAGSQR